PSFALRTPSKRRRPWSRWHRSRDTFSPPWEKEVRPDPEAGCGGPSVGTPMTKAAKIIRKIAGDAPIVAGLVLGSGLSALGDTLADKVAIPFSELKGFPGGRVSGHGRDLLIGEMGGKRIAILTGREHYYEHGNAAAMRPALETLVELGAHTLLLTNSAGSLNPDVGPGEL